jgi:hypothetical protein
MVEQELDGVDKYLVVLRSSGSSGANGSQRVQEVPEVLENPGTVEPSANPSNL